MLDVALGVGLERVLEDRLPFFERAHRSFHYVHLL